MNTDVPVDSVPPVSTRKRSPTLSGFWIYRQGAAVWIGMLWGIFFFFFNPEPTGPVDGVLWILIPAIINFGFYLGVTQMIPVLTAPLFESHFATLKDLGVSVWIAVFPGIAILLSFVLGTIDILWFQINVDMTLVEWAQFFLLMIAFGLDIVFGSAYTAMKNRLAQEAGLGKLGGS